VPYHDCRRIVALLLSCALTAFSSLFAQPFDARLELRYVDDGRDDVVTFDIWLTRLNDTWQRWANCTVRIDLVDVAVTGGVTSTTYRCTYVESSSDMPTGPYSDRAMTTYAIRPDIVNGRIRIVVIGPDSVDQAIPIAQTPLRIGRFELSRTDGSSVSTALAFAEPLAMWQANAGKLMRDSVTSEAYGVATWFDRHDNVPLRTAYAVRSSSVSCDTASIYAFRSTYAGDLDVQLDFDVECETTLLGFVVERSLVNPINPERLTFEPRQQLSYDTNPLLLAKRGMVTRRQINGVRDTVEGRREVYAYRLVGIEASSGRAIVYDTVFVAIPGAIIANASVLENPFQERIRIRFDVLDRVRVTARVYDLQGAMLGVLSNDQGVPLVQFPLARGTDYMGEFRLDETASQGLVNIVLIGVPDEDLAAENISRIILKAQHLR